MDEKYIRKVDQVLKGKTMGLARDILKHINDYPRQSPATLHQTLEYSLSGIKNTLVNLMDLGLVETQTRGIYVITELGKQVLENQE
jgi:predicted transcriptional regulator